MRHSRTRTTITTVAVAMAVGIGIGAYEGSSTDPAPPPTLAGRASPLHARDVAWRNAKEAAAVERSAPRSDPYDRLSEAGPARRTP